MPTIARPVARDCPSVGGEAAAVALPSSLIAHASPPAPPWCRVGRARRRALARGDAPPAAGPACPNCHCSVGLSVGPHCEGERYPPLCPVSRGVAWVVVDIDISIDISIGISIDISIDTSIDISIDIFIDASIDVSVDISIDISIDIDMR